jgi:ABC-type glutathione transport system ATPase component
LQWGGIYKPCFAPVLISWKHWSEETKSSNKQPIATSPHRYIATSFHLDRKIRTQYSEDQRRTNLRQGEGEDSTVDCSSSRMHLPVPEHVVNKYAHCNWPIASTYTKSLVSLSVGESGLGKSTLVNTLFNAPLYPAKEHVPLTDESPKTVGIQVLNTDIEENGVRLKLNVVDTPGFGDYINNEER